MRSITRKDFWSSLQFPNHNRLTNHLQIVLYLAHIIFIVLQFMENLVYENNVILNLIQHKIPM